MFNFTCRYCNAQMAAYTHGELPLKARRRIARHLDECSACYAKYNEARELNQQLGYFVPLIGQPHAPQLQRIWAGVQAGMTPPPNKQNRYPLSLRYSFVAFMLVLTFLLPLTLGNRNVPFSVPSQPKPPAVTTVVPVTKEKPAVAVALVVTDDKYKPLRISLRNTPEPRTAR
jgi:anti-sigma factor RsiW